MPSNGLVEDFARERLSVLSAQSERDDVVLIEVLYRDKWVQFDVSAMEAKYLSADELVQRYLKKAFDAVSLPREDAVSSS